MVDGYGLMRGAHEAGRVRVLAITSRQRHPNLPDVPTVNEAGVPGYEFTSWSAIAAPAATPPAILRRLEDAMRWTMENTDLPQTLLGFGTFPAFAPGAEVRELVAKERDTWTRVAREVNIRAD
jgi:tripartite-type tricarboxylate transporter receptor subunit TctC